MRSREVLFCALMVAVLAVLAQLALPLGPVPFTLSIFGVYLAGGLLGERLGVLSMLAYLLLGAFGAPVFSGGRGGLPVLAGPTGGFLWGYVIATYLIGRVFSRRKRVEESFLKIVLVFTAGLAVIYLAGVCQLRLVLGMNWSQALAVGVTPFVLPDLVKVVAAALVIRPVRRALAQAGLLPPEKKF
ncbi:MAG TPA: biotin transporter BioY [Clostridia bacterium]|nr:biotin transporter BioY [Clostridia bacterium]